MLCFAIRHDPTPTKKGEIFNLEPLGCIEIHIGATVPPTVSQIVSVYLDEGPPLSIVAQLNHINDATAVWMSSVARQTPKAQHLHTSHINWKSQERIQVENQTRLKNISMWITVWAPSEDNRKQPTCDNQSTQESKKIVNCSCDKSSLESRPNI